ncbi:MAG: hypothetical protein FJ291_21985 [Planctomycetes bacterium]|nr:hypothetical protein [Planctomycetota bacterium]
MLSAGVLTFREFAMHEPLPLATVHQRRGQPKSGTDWRDLAMLLLQFPALKRPRGPVLDCLQATGAGPDVLAAWQHLVAQQLRPREHGA